MKKIYITPAISSEEIEDLELLADSNKHANDWEHQDGYSQEETDPDKDNDGVVDDM